MSILFLVAVLLVNLALAAYFTRSRAWLSAAFSVAAAAAVAWLILIRILARAA